MPLELERLFGRGILERRLQLRADDLHRIGVEVVEEVAEAMTFYPAEEYHQRYYEQNPHQPYCQFVVAPKVAKAEGKFADRLKA